MDNMRQVQHWGPTYLRHHPSSVLHRKWNWSCSCLWLL